MARNTTARPRASIPSPIAPPTKRSRFGYASWLTTGGGEDQAGSRRRRSSHLSSICGTAHGEGTAWKVIDIYERRQRSASQHEGRGLPTIPQFTRRVWMNFPIVVFRRVCRPVHNGISNHVCRQTCQNICPWYRSLTQELRGPAVALRDGLDSRAARAKRHGLARNAAVVLRTVGTRDEVAIAQRDATA